jgi:hypothetical protein
MAGGAVDQRRTNVRRETPGSQRSARDLFGAVQLEGVAVAAVGAQHDVGGEHCDQRFEVALPGGCEVRVDDRPLTGQVWVRRRRGLAHAAAGAAGELAGRLR